MTKDEARAAVQKIGAEAVAEALRRGASHARFTFVEMTGLEDPQPLDKPFWNFVVRKDGKTYQKGVQDSLGLPEFLPTIIEACWDMPPFAEAQDPEAASD